jgi:hypothetical protein
MEMMKQKQKAFAATISAYGNDEGAKADSEPEDLCIICRCDDADGENNGPLGYLGHVQRSRIGEKRVKTEMWNSGGMLASLAQAYRVVGHKGCQVRPPTELSPDASK